MFSTFRQKLLLGIYIFILLSIPVGAYLASQQQTVQSRASEKKTAKPLSPVTPKPATSSARQLLDASAKLAKGLPTVSPSPSPLPSSPTIATSYGPTLSLKVILDARPTSNQAVKLFVGILEGTLTSNPKFLLSFSVDLPLSGQYSGLSLAGLNPGSEYTALLKGPAQIASSATFTMSPTVTNLNNGEPITLLSGDLNDDNVVNSADYSIAQKALGSSPASANWNDNADLNSDRVINTFDLAIITKNMGQIGASGAWTSPLPKVATPSAGLNGPATGSPMAGDGYWLWLPR